MYPLDNLTIRSSSRFNINDNSPFKFQKVFAICPDPDNSNAAFLCLLSDDCESIFITSTDSLSDIKIIASFPASSSDFSISSFKYRVETSSFVVALSYGDLLSISLDGKVDPIGCVDSGIVDAKWSPDEDILLISSGNSTIIAMTNSFEFINEVCIETGEFGRDEFINVGWGKKETQFHGSIGKSAATASKASTRRLSEYENFAAHLSWRGDGAFFCCSSVNSTGDQRFIRVYDRDLVLVSTSEVVAGIDSTICWKPSGNLITSSVKSPNGYQIIFFERNGLRHGEFLIKCAVDKFQVENVSWNSDSSLLAVSLLIQDKITIQIYSNSNYNWYLKYVFEIGDFQSSLFNWDSEIPLRAHISNEKLIYDKIDLDRNINSSRSSSIANIGTLAVIDGDLLQLTPYKLSNVPPPMSLLQIYASSQIIDVAFDDFSDGNNFAILTSDCKISVFEATYEDKKYTASSFAELNLPLGTYRSLLWIDSTSLLIHRSDMKNDTLVLVKFENSAITDMEFVEVRNASHVLYSFLKKKVYYLDLFGDIFEVDMVSQQTVNIVRITRNVKKITLLYQDDHDEVFIYQTKNRKLFAGAWEISSDCDSFAATKQYLIYTTSQHQLISKHVDLLFNSRNVVPEQLSRGIERGATIACVPPGSTGVILQLPRGNLETIHPRPLVLLSICDNLEKLNYKDALITCRKHRIDMNVLVDYNPDGFVLNCAEFLSQIINEDHLNLFLSDLRNEDITTSLYDRMIKRKSTLKSPSFFNEKINTICKVVRDILESNDNIKKYLNSISLTYLRESPQNLEEMLKRISDAREHLSNDIIEEALQFTKIFVNVDKLYDLALGIYDFELVLSIAQQSNKDPREYIPFISKLKAMDTYYQRYSVDDYLKKYDKALENLALCGPEYYEECLGYIDKRKLYRQALRIFFHDRKMFKAIMANLAQYFREESKYNDAAIAYQCAELFIDAVECFKISGSWKEAFVAASQARYCDEEIVELSEEFSELLVDQNKFLDAALVLRDYAKDYKGSIYMFVKARSWTDAIQLAYANNLSHLLNDLIHPSVLQAYKEIEEDVIEYQKSFTKLYDRLVEVRRKKYDFEHEEEEEAANIEVIDTLTEVGTMDKRTVVSSLVSGLTSATGSSSRTSSKSRRKTERRKVEAKEGSVYEEESLVGRIKRLIQKTNRLENDIVGVIPALMQFGSFMEASKLQKDYGNLKKKISAQFKDVFEPVRPSPHLLPTIVKYQVENCLRDGTSRDMFDSIVSIYAQQEKENLNKDLWKFEFLE